MLFTDAANKIIDIITKRANELGIGRHLWLGLSTTEPLPNGTNITEPGEATGYRKIYLGTGAYTVGSGSYATTFPADSYLPAASAGKTTNARTFFFPKAISSWGIITHAVLYASTDKDNVTEKPSGVVTPIMYTALLTPITPVVDHVAIIEPGNLEIEIE
jgi:hypothetical protein